MERGGDESAFGIDDTEDGDFHTVRQSLSSAMAGLFQRIVNVDAHPPFKEIVSNENVLDQKKNGRPDTLSEIQCKAPSPWWLSFDTQAKGEFQDFWMYVRNAAFLKEMRHAATLHERLLPVQTHGFFDVWVVCRRFGTLYESFRHWTVITQGHMFHLKADKDAKKNMKMQTGLGCDHMCNVSFLKKLLMKQGISTPIYYDHVDFEEMLGEQPPKDNNKHKYIAYHVGQTAYSWCEVDLLAKDTLEQMLMHDIGSYDMFGNNCQHFVLSLVRRIVMTQRKPIAVGGSRLRIAQWTSGRPGLKLTPWLTKKKARWLMLPNSTTKTIPVFSMFLTTGAPITLHYANTIPRLIDKIHFRGALRKELRGLVLADDRLDYLKRQCREHLSDKLTWKNYGKSIWGWFGAVGLLGEAADEAQRWGTTFLKTAALKSVPASKLTAFAASLPYETILVGGLASYWIITRTFFGRGSLTIRHMDIVPIATLAHPQMDLSLGADPDGTSRSTDGPPLPPRALYRDIPPPLPPRALHRDIPPPLPPRKVDRCVPPPLPPRNSDHCGPSLPARRLDDCDS